MSFIAAVLILNLDTADAFIAFANLLNKPCQMAFFRVDHSLVSTRAHSHITLTCEHTSQVSVESHNFIGTIYRQIEKVITRQETLTI